MLDRRKHPRKHLVFFGRVYHRQTGELLGNLADITIQGFMVIGEHPQKPDLKFPLRLELPEQIFGKNHLDLNALSVWSHPDLIPTLHNTGFQLMDVSEEDLAILERIIREYSAIL